MRNAPSVIVAFCFFVGALLTHSVADELDREIEQVKKEIERVNAQRTEENALAKKEEKEFEAYKKRVAGRRATLLRQADSMQTNTAAIRATNDSLAARLRTIERRINEQDLQQEYIRKSVISAVETVALVVDSLPPLIAQQYRAPLQYLKSELTGKTVENTEALFRLMRIVQDVRTLSQDIQVVEGNSPVQAVRGSVYRLRIGAFFEAVVDPLGSKAYLWCRDSTEQSLEQYMAIDDPAVAASLLKAVKIREGKSIPDLVDLPLHSTTGAGGVK